MTQVETHEMLPDYVGSSLTDLQLQAQIGHFAHLAARLPYEEEKRAAVEKGAPYLQDFRNRAIQPPDFSKIIVRAEENKLLWGRTITIQSAEIEPPKPLKPNRRKKGRRNLP